MVLTIFKDKIGLLSRVNLMNGYRNWDPFEIIKMITFFPYSQCIFKSQPVTTPILIAHSDIDSSWFSP